MTGERTLLNRVVILACLVVLAGAAVKGTAALYVAQTAHAGSTYNTGAVYDPSAITGVPLDNTENVSWTDPGHNNGNGNGFAILAYHQGPTANTACSTNQADYTFVKGVASNVAVPVTDNGVFGGSSASYYASYTCYMVRTWDVPGVAPASWTSLTVPTWTSQIAPAPANQYVTPSGVAVGFFPTSVTLGNNDGIPASGDTITITYNQATSAPNLAGLNVCFDKATASVFIGQNVTVTPCDLVGGTSVGVLAGTLFKAPPKDGVAAATYAWSNGNKTLTVTLGAIISGAYSGTLVGPWTFTASQAPEAGQPIVKSADGTIFPCNANHTILEGIPPGSLQTNVCLPTTATNF